jgi:SOS-response transcriptional repressor LexA
MFLSRTSVCKFIITNLPDFTTRFIWGLNKFLKHKILSVIKYQCTFISKFAIIKNPISTFYGRVKGDSMHAAGVDDGDLLVIDKSLEYRTGAIAVCALNGEFTLKYIKRDGKRVWLMPANPDFRPIEVKEEDEFTVWGIVIWVIKKVY